MDINLELEGSVDESLASVNRFDEFGDAVNKSSVCINAFSEFCDAFDELAASVNSFCSFADSVDESSKKRCSTGILFDFEQELALPH